MKQNTRITITLYGEIPFDPEQWLLWYDFAKASLNQMGKPANWASVQGKEITPAKYTKIERADKKIKTAALKSRDFESVEVLFLPEGFKQAVFDYDVSFIRCRTLKASHVSLSMLPIIYNAINVEQIISEAKVFINFLEGEIFKMETRECPIFYASKANASSFYRTLEVEKHFM